MTTTEKPVTRVTRLEHTRHRRTIVCTLGPGDVIGFRLSGRRADTTAYLPIEMLSDLAERKRAEALSGFSAEPCRNPKAARNV